MPRSLDLRRLARASRACRGCPLYRRATQTVFGTGPPKAPVMLVGEQPGDREDRVGLPFVGPAGAELAAALEAAGLPGDRAYRTNAVKHFKFEERGKRRIHKKPRRLEIDACLPWLEAEIEAIGPAVVVALGATAAEALARRRDIREGTLIRSIHPAAVLRVPDRERRRRLHARLVRDLRKAGRLAAKRQPSSGSGGIPSSRRPSSRTASE